MATEERQLLEGLKIVINNSEMKLGRPVKSYEGQTKKEANMLSITFIFAIFVWLQAFN